MLCGFLGQSSPNLNFGSERQIIIIFFAYCVVFRSPAFTHLWMELKGACSPLCYEFNLCIWYCLCCGQKRFHFSKQLLFSLDIVIAGFVCCAVGSWLSASSVFLLCPNTATRRHHIQRVAEEISVRSFSPHLMHPHRDATCVHHKLCCCPHLHSDLHSHSTSSRFSNQEQNV